jgi:TonB-dependent starch-binding outer membrane protein SusC
MRASLRSKTPATMAIVLLFLLTCQVAWAQVVVSGTVTDDTGEIIPGVNVLVEGTSVGTTTDAEGRYSLSVDGSQSVLVYSFIGFTTQREPVGNRTTIDVKLAPDLTTLQEVVVVGYGAQPKRNLTGAIGHVTAENIQQRQAINVMDALQGTVAGLQISSNSGAPGADNSIMIRGASTFSDVAVKPLFIVDGMIVSSIDGINPNDIKSIEVLKDGASAAIYGARSANGVIIITTKSGEDGKPRLDVRFLQSYSSMANKLPQVNAFERTLNDPSTRGRVIEKYSVNNDSVGLVNSTSNDYQEILSRTARRSDLGLSISGGTKKLTYFTGLNYIDEQGIIITSFLKKATLRTNIDYEASNKVKFGSRIGFGYRKTNNISEGDALAWALKRITNYIIYYPDGSLAPVYAMGGQRNPVQEITGRKRETNIYDGNLSQYMEIKFTDWLQLRASATGIFALRRFNEFRSKELDSNGNEDARMSAGSDETDWKWTSIVDAYATAAKKFGNHNVSLMLGTSAQSDRIENLRYRGNNFLTESGPSTMNLLTLSSRNDDTYTRVEEASIASVFGRLTYDYKGKYIINALFRNDGSSRFGPENRWAKFTSASAAWRFSDESFMEWSGRVLNDGKFRISYGANGNDGPLGPYDWRSLYEGGHSYNGIAGVSVVPNFGNPLLKWEETEQTNVGLDLEFLSGRVSFTGDYYQKTTKSLLQKVNLPTNTGYPSMFTNTAHIQNRGVELIVSAYPIPKTSKFSWQTVFNFFKNKNRIMSLDREDYVKDNIWYVAAGHAAGNFYGYQYQGIYQYDASNAYTADYSTRLIPVVQRDGDGNVVIAQNGEPIVESYQLPNGETYTGEVKQLEVNGVIARGGDVIWENLADANGDFDNKIDDADRKLLGNAQPKWDFSWTNNITYKRFNLTFNFYARWGGMIYNKFKHGYSSWGGNLHNQYPDYVRTGWKWPGQITDWYWISNNRNYNYRELSSFFLEDGSFIRLRNVRLSYTLDNKLTEKAYMKNVQVYVYGTNLLTWTNYSGYDPEIGGGVLSPGRDSATYPRKREVGFGVNIGF